MSCISPCVPNCYGPVGCSSYYSPSGFTNNNNATDGLDAEAITSGLVTVAGLATSPYAPVKCVGQLPESEVHVQKPGIVLGMPGPILISGGQDTKVLGFTACNTSQGYGSQGNYGCYGSSGNYGCYGSSGNYGSFSGSRCYPSYRPC